MKIKDYDDSTRKLIHVARVFAKFPSTDRLRKLQRQVEDYDTEHAAEMEHNLMSALADVVFPEPKFEWCDMCDGVGLMEGWNHRDGYPCPKCRGAAKLPCAG